MARPRTQGPKTREKILDVALALFVELGYEKTSLRDIAERLGITKAALYYYFERKDEILMELHMRLHALAGVILEDIESVEGGPARVAVYPQMIERLVDELISNRQLMLMHRRNTNAIAALYVEGGHQLENDNLDARVERLLRTPGITLSQRVRMAAAIGAVTELFADSGAAFDDVPAEELRAQLSAAITDLLSGRTAV